MCTIFESEFDNLLTLGQAKDCINEKRMFFGCQAIKVVATFFNGKQFVNNRGHIVAYARWAIRTDGPGV